MAWQADGPNRALLHLRLNFLLAAIVVTAALLLGRLWWVQIACGDIYDQLSAGTRTRHIPLRAPRGVIYDRAGRALAVTEPRYMVVVDPMELRRHSTEERAEIFNRTASLLSLSVGDMQDLLDRSRQAGFDTIKLKSDVGPAIITRLLEHANELPGIDVERAPVRVYPMGGLAAHVLGYLSDITSQDLKLRRLRGYNGADQIGEQGLEREYENQLRGQDGERVIEVNARGVPVSGQDRSRTPPSPGDNLVLTLDSRLQRIAQTKFPGDFSGSVVVLDVHTGGILALASRPGFDPNSFIQDSDAARKERTSYLLDTQGRPMQNRAIMSRYPPGSTFKLVTSAAGFAHGAIDPEDVVFCDEGMRLSRRGGWKKCWSWHGHVNYKKAMAQSCDTYFYTLMKRLSSTQLADMARRLGLGQRTGLDLPSEARGFIPTPTWKDRRFHRERWWFGDSCNMAIGQGFLQVTPLQMAVVTAAIANGGYVLRPHLVASIKSPTGGVLQRIGPEVRGRIPVSDTDLARIREGMRAAVLPGGTAGIVRFNSLDVGGKTGSAQDLPHAQTHAWFVCFAPYENPQIAICVMVEHGGHGGIMAGPVARALLNSYFNLNEPDKPPSIRTD